MSSKLKAFITPEVLRWARESINMEFGEAADRIGTSRDRLFDWEEGLDVPSIQQMRKASEVYKRPLAAFYLPAPPRDFRVPQHDFRRLPDSELNEYPPEFLLELRRMQYHRAIATTLAETREYPIKGYLGSRSGDDRPTDVAADVRETLGVSVEVQTQWRDEYHALNEWKNAIERLGVLVFHFERVPISIARGVSDSSYPLPFIGLNGKDSPQARIFTLIHEFSHLLLSNTGVCDTRERRKSKRPEDQVETFCNHVAGATLLPRAALLAHPVVQRHGPSMSWTRDELRAVAEHFRVSMEVVARRLLSVGRTSVEHYQKHRKDIANVKKQRKGGRMPVPRRTLRRIGQPFARLVIDAYHDERITGSDLAEYLGTRLKWLPALEQLLSGPNALTGNDQ